MWRGSHKSIACNPAERGPRRKASCRIAKSGHKAHAVLCTDRIPACTIVSLCTINCAFAGRRRKPSKACKNYKSGFVRDSMSPMTILLWLPRRSNVKRERNFRKVAGVLIVFGLLPKPPSCPSFNCNSHENQHSGPNGQFPATNPNGSSNVQ